MRKPKRPLQFDPNTLRKLDAVELERVAAGNDGHVTFGACSGGNVCSYGWTQNRDSCGN
jgi:hypothetical protein